MSDWITTTQLLAELRMTKSGRAWSEFNNHFQPVIIKFAMKLGFSHSDAEDAAQETWTTFLQKFNGGRYDREKGRLSSWLLGIARRVVLNMRGHRPSERLMADKTTGTSFWDLIEDDDGLQQIWDAEWDRMVWKRCLERARHEFTSKTIEAFQLYGIDQIPIDEVRQQLDMTRNAVYTAKCRVTTRLSELAAQFEGTLEERPDELSRI